MKIFGTYSDFYPLATVLQAGTCLIQQQTIQYTMKYSTPTILAQNEPRGNYAAGCPSNYNNSDYACRQCDRAK